MILSYLCKVINQIVIADMCSLIFNGIGSLSVFIHIVSNNSGHVNGRAPDSIEYEGAYISYYDLLYNFALITQNHTDGQHMDFNKEYHFEKLNDSILLHILPFVLILLVLFVAYKFMKRIRKF